MSPYSRNLRNERRIVLSLTPSTPAMRTAVARPLVCSTRSTYSSVDVKSRLFAAAMDRAEKGASLGAASPSPTIPLSGVDEKLPGSGLRPNFAQGGGAHLPRFLRIQRECHRRLTGTMLDDRQCRSHVAAA